MNFKNKRNKTRLAYALTAVMLNEGNEDFACGLEDIGNVLDVFEKVCELLSKEELTILAGVRPNTFEKAMKDFQAIEECFACFNTHDDGEEGGGDD